jgi:hypothetical protein
MAAVILKFKDQSQNESHCTTARRKRRWWRPLDTRAHPAARHPPLGQFPRRAQPPAAGVIIDEDDYQPEFSGSDDVEDDGGGDGSGSGADTGGPAGAASPWALRFPELRAAIDAAIARLGGAVAPKLNWSSPTDAVWVSPSSSLRCRSAEQVVLLLKSSPRAAFDLELCDRLRAGAGCADAAPALALRAWRDVPPERELRCFVHGHRPVGICQRDLGQAFPQAPGAGSGERARLRDAVCEFQARHFGSGFARESCEWCCSARARARTHEPARCVAHVCAHSRLLAWSVGLG